MRSSFQPPLYAWLAALGMKMSPDLDPLASVLPSYVAGVLLVVLVYLQGRVWRGAWDWPRRGSSGSTPICSCECRRRRRRRWPWPARSVPCSATPGTSAAEESVRRWPWAGPIFWAVAGGFSLGLSLLSLGRFRADRDPGRVLASGLSASWIKFTPAFPHACQVPLAGLVANRGVIDGLLSLAIAFLVALPWHIRMFQMYGWDA